MCRNSATCLCFNCTRSAVVAPSSFPVCQRTFSLRLLRFPIYHSYYKYTVQYFYKFYEYIFVLDAYKLCTTLYCDASIFWLNSRSRSDANAVAALASAREFSRCARRRGCAAYEASHCWCARASRAVCAVSCERSTRRSRASRQSPALSAALPRAPRPPPLCRPHEWRALGATPPAQRVSVALQELIPVISKSLLLESVFLLQRRLQVTPKITLMMLALSAARTGIWKVHPMKTIKTGSSRRDRHCCTLANRRCTSA